MDNGVGKRLGITISLSLSAGGGGRHGWGLADWEAQCRGSRNNRGGVFFLN